MHTERARWIADTLAREGYGAFVCRLPQNVVMLTGYQPILGNSFCLVTAKDGRDPRIRLVVPTDEADLAPADDPAITVKTFAEETMTRISTTLPSVREPLAALLREAGLGQGSAVVGYEGGRAPVAGYYTQIGVPGPNTLDLLRDLLPGAVFRDATDALEGLASVKTDAELRWIRTAEEVALYGFEAARQTIRAGVTEAEVAGAAHATLYRAGYASPGARHVTAHVHVMSGPRAAAAYKAFNLTSNRAIEGGDPVSVQMEVCINGYWAELTRPFYVGEASDAWARAHQACMRAQDAALQVIRDGVAARAADAAARAVMRDAGYGAAFKHGLGHGFGFQAINHAAAPILHPASDAVLRAGMVHNMEPAVYLDGKGGIRLNDNVLVRAEGSELLSRDIPRELEWLVVRE